jgi:ethanolamine-phosphate cytidylyltransferase
MTLAERVAAVDACRWSTLSVPHAPYVTSLPWISHYGCQYVVHGDDITSDSNGEDCYRYVKAAGRFLVVKRTPGISTTDLVGRMLLCTKTHFIRSLHEYLVGYTDAGKTEDTKKQGHEMLQRIKEYATDESGLKPGQEVWTWSGPQSLPGKPIASDEAGIFSPLVSGLRPKPGQKIVYVDGGFDLFTPGHIAFLRAVHAAEHNADIYVVAGVHDDHVINQWKGLNYPIMNIFERGLCVLQCRYINAVVLGAPFTPTKAYLEALPLAMDRPTSNGGISAVYHGATAFMPLTYDPYVDAKEMGVYHETSKHDFENINAGEIVGRIMAGRAAFEERQRKKGIKAAGEEVTRRRELLEQEAAEKEKARMV